MKLVQAGVCRKEALRIATEEWGTMDAVALPEGREDFTIKRVLALS